MSIGLGVDVLAAATDAAISRGVPASLAEKASRVALARAREGGEPWVHARIEAYYWGVLRRLILRGGEDSAAVRKRLLAASTASPVARGAPRQERLPLAG